MTDELKAWSEERAYERAKAEYMKKLDGIRAEIEKVFCMSVVTNELRTPMEVKTEILQIIDKYRGSEGADADSN
jgi:uncharacterized protein (DUF1015 family)